MKRSEKSDSGTKPIEDVQRNRCRTFSRKDDDDDKITYVRCGTTDNGRVGRMKAKMKSVAKKKIGG